MLNQVIIRGNLVKDIQVNTQKGAPLQVGELRLANSKRKDGGDGERVYVDVILFGGVVETATKYLKKGDPVIVIGNLVTQQWVDKKTNEPRQRIVIHCTSLEFLPKETKSFNEQGRQPLQVVYEVQKKRTEAKIT